MINRILIQQIIRFLLFFLFQIIIFRNVVVFNVAFCYIYVGFLLLIPLETNAIVLMLTGFLMGLFNDMFYDSLGIHAAACVFLMYVRRHWSNLITPRGGYELNMLPSPQTLGLSWFSSYALPLIFVHHALLFFIELGGFHLFFFTLLKVVSSTIFTFTVLVIIQYLVSSPKKKVI